MEQIVICIRNRHFRNTLFCSLFVFYPKVIWYISQNIPHWIMLIQKGVGGYLLKCFSFGTTNSWMLLQRQIIYSRRAVRQPSGKHQCLLCVSKRNSCFFSQHELCISQSSGSCLVIVVSDGCKDVVWQKLLLMETSPHSHITQPADRHSSDTGWPQEGEQQQQSQLIKLLGTLKGIKKWK